MGAETDAELTLNSRPATHTGPGVLLLGAGYYGTPAAARCYGRAGIRVTMADASRTAPYSRYVRERLVHPPLTQPELFLQWLFAWGERNPGTFLCPTNDNFSWLFALHRARLAGVFLLLNSSSEAAIFDLLDKKRLHQVCADAALDVPETQALGDGGADNKLTVRFRYPLLLKPRTQISLASGIKGFIVRNQASLAPELSRFKQLVRFHQVLQRPRKLGIGLRFEGRDVEPALVAKLSALCRRIGYHGVFEAEFIAEGDCRLLIDFNPRFYSQMGFEIARGCALPLMAWHGARGERAKLDREIAAARAWTPTGPEAYCHKSMLDLVPCVTGAVRPDVRCRRPAVASVVRGPATLDDRRGARLRGLPTGFARRGSLVGQFCETSAELPPEHRLEPRISIKYQQGGRLAGTTDVRH